MEESSLFTSISLPDAVATSGPNRNEKECRSRNTRNRNVPKETSRSEQAGGDRFFTKIDSEAAIWTKYLRGDQEKQRGGPPRSLYGWGNSG